MTDPNEPNASRMLLIRISTAELGTLLSMDELDATIRGLAYDPLTGMISVVFDSALFVETDQDEPPLVTPVLEARMAQPVAADDPGNTVTYPDVRFIHTLWSDALAGHLVTPSD